MAISQDDINNFINTLDKTPPDWDPDWKITKALIEIVRIQAGSILTLERRLKNLKAAVVPTINSMAGSVADGANIAVATDGPSATDVNAAITALNEAVSLASDATQYVKYAGLVLKFVSKVLV